MANIQPDVPEKFWNDFATDGVLSTLKPLDQSAVENVVKRFEGLSLKYVNFISNIGVGETRSGLYIYSPYSASELTNHPSFKIYNSASSRQLFGLVPAKPAVSPKLVCVADSGASWRYCLDLSRGDEVVCFDMLGAEATIESEDFFSFIEQHVFPA